MWLAIVLLLGAVGFPLLFIRYVITRGDLGNALAALKEIRETVQYGDVPAGKKNEEGRPMTVLEWIDDVALMAMPSKYMDTLPPKPIDWYREDRD